MATIRIARKNRSSFGVEIKKGEKYLDKGFGQIEKISRSQEGKKDE